MLTFWVQRNSNNMLDPSLAGVSGVRQDWVVGREAHHPPQRARENGAPGGVEAREPRERAQVRYQRLSASLRRACRKIARMYPIFFMCAHAKGESHWIFPSAFRNEAG